MEKDNKTLHEPERKLTESNTGDDTEDYIQPSQPMSFQASSLDSASKKNSDDISNMSFSVDNESPSEPASIISTPFGSANNDLIPSSEIPVKRSISNSDTMEEDACKKKINLDDTNLVKGTQDMFSTQSEVDTTADAVNLKVPESPSILGSQSVSEVPESPCHINETPESETSMAVFSDSEKQRTSGETMAEDTQVPGFDGSSVERCEVVDGRKESERSLKLLENPPSSPHAENDKDMNKQKQMDSQIALDETIDANEIQFYQYSSEKTDTDGMNGGNVPPVSDGISTPVEKDPSSKSDMKVAASGFKLKIKHISDEEPAMLQKHSTPEDPLSKSLKINESTSSIENGTPPAQDDNVKCEFTFSVFLQVNCQVALDPVTKLPVSKKILNVKELVKRQPKQIFLEPSSDSSLKTKRLSSSSAGSVYSDKTGLPYALPRRPSTASDATMASNGSSVDIAKRIEISNRQLWENEYMLPMVIDDLIPRYIEENFREVDKSESFPISKRKTSIRIKKKSYRNDPLSSVLESSVTEPSSGNNSPSLIKSESSQPLESAEANKSKSMDANFTTGEGTKDENARNDQKVSHEGKENVGGGSNRGKEESVEDILAEGMPIFARWTDKRYYPGKLKSKAKYDRWEVQFDDKAEKIIPEYLILPLKWLSKGELVFALMKDKYMSGKISEIIRGKEIKFKIELDDTGNEVTIKKSDICLNDVMAGIIREKFKAKAKMNTPLKSVSDIDVGKRADTLPDSNLFVAARVSRLNTSPPKSSNENARQRVVFPIPERLFYNLTDNVVPGKRVREQKTPVRAVAIAPQTGSSTKKKKKKAGAKIWEGIPENKQTPKANVSSMREQESDSSRTRSKKKQKKLDSSVEEQAPEGNRGNASVDAIPSTSKDTPIRLDSKQGMKKRARTLIYDSEPEVSIKRLKITLERSIGKSTGVLSHKKKPKIGGKISKGETDAAPAYIEKRRSKRMEIGNVRKKDAPASKANKEEKLRDNKSQGRETGRNMRKATLVNKDTRKRKRK